jgi:hypothetical protein
MLDVLLRAEVGEAGRQPRQQPDAPIGLPQQQSPPSLVSVPPPKSATTDREK